MASVGWKPLLAGWPWFQGPGRYPIAAYSEFVPPPRLARKPYGQPEPGPRDPADLDGWQVTEYEEGLQLQPGFRQLAHVIVGALAHLARGEHVRGLAQGRLEGNPYWPPELAEHAASLVHERYIILFPLALSRTQDDKGRVRWTLFGGSEHGPARAFWRGFCPRRGQASIREPALEFLSRLLHTVYGEAEPDLHRARLRILSARRQPNAPWTDGPLPTWTRPLRITDGQSVRGIRYLLTFRPFQGLPPAVRRAYLGGDLHLLPCPGSLLFWGIGAYQRLRKELPLAAQIPLLHLIARHEDPYSIRVPQSGWLHEPRSGKPGPDGRHGSVINTYKRTHRWDRVHRTEDDLEVIQGEDKLAHVLFSTAPQDVGLYGKPMARNVQIWSHDFRLLLDGPRADRDAIERASDALREGGLFGYRFQFPAMRVGRHEIYWHRPLAAYLPGPDAEPALLPDPPLGYLTAYDSDRPNLTGPVELWPRLLQRDLHADAVALFDRWHDDHPLRTMVNVRKLLDTRDLLGRPLPRTLARQLLTLPKGQTLRDWLDALPIHAADAGRGDRLTRALEDQLEPENVPAPSAGRPAKSLTFVRSARRSFEVAYWKTIAGLAEGGFVNKDNADCVRDAVTQECLRHHHRDLEALGDYLIAYYERTIAKARMGSKALVGDLPFHWRTDFNFSWSGGWLHNQEGRTEERDIVVVIPGRDRRRAVIMGDHYDTAYMADHYDKSMGGNGARLAAAGADDNHSATAALMLAAPIFLDLSRRGQLGCDIWLIHLTGEEFPSDCLGARHLCQRLVEGTMRLRLPGGRTRDLSRTRVQGVYVLDMVAHNNDHDRDVFQISPGTGSASMWLALQAHLAAEAWNRSADTWNRRPSRRGRGRGQRSPDGGTVPNISLHPRLSGEVRPPQDPRSTLYNTDGQIFSDAGIPVVLFMENYDINRAGYHDSHDTMANIDLDYGAAVAAIAIESVARAATEKPPRIFRAKNS